MNPIKQLISKLDTSCYQALEKAVGLAVSRTHYHIEIEHYLLALLGQEETLLYRALQQLNVGMDQLHYELHQALEQLKRGHEKAPAISETLIDWVREAWSTSSLDEGVDQIDSGALLSSLFSQRTLMQLCASMSPQLQQLNTQALAQLLIVLRQQQSASAETPSDNNSVRSKTSKTPALNQYTINLNAQAVAGKLDAAIGREHEIYQIADILSRRRQNNVILTGEPGVGKTALVEGLALRIINEDVPDGLKKTVIHTLDLALLQAGAGVKGEFENRLKGLIDEIKGLAHPVILFIDEAHSLIGAGGTAGQGDAANLLKPALARGELRSIAATTWSEYKQYFEKDAALTRRFQMVKVEEPSAEIAIRMLRSMVGSLERHHQVKILDQAIVQATLLSDRYISGRQLPDKSISVLDTACARVGSKLSAKPAEITYLEKKIAEDLQELNRLQRESQWQINHHQRIEALDKCLKKDQLTLDKLMGQWQQQQQLCCEIVAVANQLSDELSLELTIKKRQSLSVKLKKAKRRLVTLQNQDHLVQPFVDEEAVAEVIADWTGIPLKRMMKDDVSRLVYLDDQLRQRIVGQDHALLRIADSVKSAQVKLSDPNKPLGVFLFVGPSGVGKTETARALAEQLYGSERKMTTINMSEFKEEHKVSMLAGSPPGYVGYGEGGVLTEAVRRQPYSLILLDEMEKAHPGVQEVFYQVFDAGEMKDGQGRDINFKNSLIIMTSNACSEEIEKICAKSKLPLTADEIAVAIYPSLSRYFKPAFLGRVTVVPYLPLSQSVMKNICLFQLEKLAARILFEHQIKVVFTTVVVKAILSQCQQQQIGARQIEEVIAAQLQPVLADQILKNLLDKKRLSQIKVNLDKQGAWSFRLDEHKENKIKK